MGFKNFPVLFSSVRGPGRTVAVGDCMGTAAAFPRQQRLEYMNNKRTVNSMGNEGFNLDPPWVDPVNGEVAYSMDEILDEDDSPPTAGAQDEVEGIPARSAIDPRHGKHANILWLDGHVSPETFESLGYVLEEGGVVGLEGNNSRWSTDQKNRCWLAR
jgi:prepilin-type processing-associated H-X9-DG protein